VFTLQRQYHLSHRYDGSYWVFFSKISH